MKIYRRRMRGWTLMWTTTGVVRGRRGRLTVTLSPISVVILVLMSAWMFWWTSDMYRSLWLAALRSWL